ncbi:MAG: hypothetical protein LLG08_03155 [Actinomycetia bacterium]|nr:hypothetical protein [Actinomycetes bacterium]
MTAKELHDRLQTTDGWGALPAAWKALLEDFDAALGETATTLFNAQQALLTEWQARNAAEERAEKAENKRDDLEEDVNRLADDCAWRDGTCEGLQKERDTLAAQLAECKRLSRERDTMLDEAGNKILLLKAELADYRAYYEWSVSPQKNGDIPEVIAGEVWAVIDRIEACRAKEAER